MIERRHSRRTPPPPPSESVFRFRLLLSTFNCQPPPRSIPAQHQPTLPHSRTPPITPVPFPISATVLPALPSAHPVSFQNKAHISYQPHQTIALISPYPYNSFHLQRVRVSVRYSGNCRSVANLFEISFLTLVRQMLPSSAGLTFGKK